MRAVVVTVLALGLLCGLSVSDGGPGERPLKVFVLAGTSNMLGAAAKIDKLPDDLRQPLKEVLVYQKGEWVPLEAGKNLVGNEATFGRAMAKHLGEPIGIIWISVASASGKSPGTGINNVVKQSREKGRPIVIAGMLLDVSFRDGIKEETAKAYGENLVRWVETTRQDLGNTNLPIVMNRAIPPGPPYLEVVRKAQDAAKLSSFRVFDCDDVQRGSDKVHFTTEGRLEMGKRFAAAMIELIKAEGPTQDDLTKLISRLIELDSIDLAPLVKHRSGLEPSLHRFDADESGMTPLKDPYSRFGENKPGAAGWYRLSFVVPERIGKFPVPKSGYNLGIESNVLGSWEIYTYKNGEPAGLWSKEGMNKATDRPAIEWMSNAPQPAKPGDKFTVAILGMASPLGRGSPEGYGLRHLRLRFAWGHTGGRQPFYGGVSGPGQGTGLLGAREMLRTKKGDELKVLQDKLRGPIARLDAVFAAADTGQIDNLTKGMLAASKEINEALKK